MAQHPRDSRHSPSSSSSPSSEKNPSPGPKLSFQPLSEGLGFHPFSDGLPYAPIAKSPNGKHSSATGTGAVAAGRPVYAQSSGAAAITAMDAGAVPANPAPYSPSRSYVPRVSVPVASQAQLPQRSLQGPAPATAQAQPAGNVSRAAPTGGLAIDASFGFGYLFKRMLAYLLDSSFNLALCGGALSAALWKQDMSPELLLNPGVVLVASLFLAVFNWAITTAQEVAFGTSLGKRVFGLVLDGTTSAIFLRAFFFLPSACFGGIGLIWSLFDRRRRCWHDMVVDLQPIELARL